MNKKQGKALSKMIALGIPLAAIATLVIFSFVWLGLVGLPLANGQTVEDFRNQIDRDAILRQDYYQYFVDHNVTSFDSVEDTQHLSLNIFL